MEMFGLLGFIFAIVAFTQTLQLKKEVDQLRSLDDEQTRLDHLQEVIEEEYLAEHKDYAAESDKAWDAMHRALSDGKLTWDGGSYPLNHVVLGGELLYTNPDYIMSLKTPVQVKEISESLRSIDTDDFRTRYFAIDADNYGFPLTEDDLEYTWEWFQNVRDLYFRAANERRYVLFTADQ